MQLMADVLSQQKDNIALIDRVIQKQDDLFDNKERLARVENFFKSQVTVFDAAARMEGDLRIELDYLSHEPEANDALNHIRMMVVVPNGFDYKKIPMLNGWMATVREGHDRLLKAKREELIGYCQQCMGAIHQAAGGHPGYAGGKAGALRRPDEKPEMSGRFPCPSYLRTDSHGGQGANEAGSLPFVRRGLDCLQNTAPCGGLAPGADTGFPSGRPNLAAPVRQLQHRTPVSYTHLTLPTKA